MISFKFILYTTCIFFLKPGQRQQRRIQDLKLQGVPVLDRGSRQPFGGGGGQGLSPEKLMCDSSQLNPGRGWLKMGFLYTFHTGFFFHATPLKSVSCREIPFEFPLWIRHWPVIVKSLTLTATFICTCTPLQILKGYIFNQSSIFILIQIHLNFFKG